MSACQARDLSGEDPTVRRRLAARLLDPNPDRCRNKTGERVTVDLAWSVRNPLAVAVTVYVRSGPGRWMVARDLLVAGLVGHAGLGDVSVLPDLGDDRCVEVVLSDGSPDWRGRFGFRVPRTAIAHFLDATWDVDTTPLVDEWLDQVTS